VERAEERARASDYAAAERLYREVLAEGPADADVLHGLGITCWLQGHAEDAIAAVRAAIALRPAFVEAMNNLGAMLVAEGQVAEAVNAFHGAIAHRPSWTAPLVNLGNAYHNDNRFDEALEAYRRAIALEPGNGDVHHLIASALGRHGQREGARAHLVESLRLDPQNAAVHSSLLFLTAYDPDLGPAVLLNEHQWWDRLHGQGMLATAPHSNTRAPERKLRIGYVSPDFRAHAVSRFMAPIYDAHDRERFEVWSYAELRARDALTERFAARSDGWRETAGLDDAAVADLIRADRIDVLVDLGGHTSGQRLSVFTRRPAPVQASYLGYPHTTGLASIQYRLTDEVLDPPRDETFSTEELVRLAGPWCCWEPVAAPDVVPPPCLANGFVTFGSLHNLLKLNDGVFDLWADVLRAVPRSRLRLVRDTLNVMAREHVRAKLGERGVSADRLDLHTAPTDGVGHLAEYESIDVSLDTLPWSGGTTTCESLWMGVPMLTLRGPRPSGRLSASLLGAVGLGELVAETPAHYVARAARLATDAVGLARMRAELRDRVRRSPLCDGAAFTGRLEAAYRDLWRRWCDAPA
jgi:protein O-GlcNAc transferase